MVALAGALRGLSAQESAIGANVANADTPGYVPSSVDFEQAIQEQLASVAPSASLSQDGGAGSAAVPLALRRTDPRHLSAAGASATDAAGTAAAQTLRNDGNSVDVDAQMSQLVDAQLRYSTVARLLTGKLGMLKSAMGQGS